MANSVASGLAAGLGAIGDTISNVNVASGFGAPAAASPGRAHARPEDAGSPVDVDGKALDATVRTLRRRARSRRAGADQLT